MRSFLIVELQPGAESGTAVGGVGIGVGIGPFAQQGLNHAFGFAVSLRAIGTSAFSGDAEPAAGFAKRSRAVSAAVVSQDPLHADAAVAEFAHCAQPEGVGGVALVIGQDLGVGIARTIVDGDVHILQADATQGVAAIAADAMARLRGGAKVLGVHGGAL